MTQRLLVATATDILAIDDSTGEVHPGDLPDGLRPSCLAVDPRRPERAWAGTTTDGILRSDDGGRSWRRSGLQGRSVLSLAASPSVEGLLWAGCEPSAVFRSPDGGVRWEPTADLSRLPSSPEWAFPPKPDTHHVRWIACHPADPDRLWLAIEAGALVRTSDGGERWHDRVPEGPHDTHELAVHPDRPDTVRIAAGDGYFESFDGGDRWETPREGFDVGYLRSVAIDPGDPDTVLVSGASRPRSTYVAGRSDGRVFRREAGGPWERVLDGWPDPPSTIAPLLRGGTEPGHVWAADERGVLRSADSGRRWELGVPFPEPPSNLRGFVVIGRP